MRLDEVAAPIQNRDRDDLLVLFGPCGTCIHQSSRAGARDHLDVSGQLHLCSTERKRNRSQHAKQKQTNACAHVISPWDLLVLVNYALRGKEPQGAEGPQRVFHHASISGQLVMRKVSPPSSVTETW